MLKTDFHQTTIRKNISIARPLACWLLLMLLLARAGVVDAQVGKRTKLQGEKAGPQQPAATSAAIRIGSVHLTPSKSAAWKGTPIANRLKAIPEEPSLYIIGNFTQTNARFKAEIEKFSKDTRIAEETPNSLVIYTSAETARKLYADQELSDIIEPLTPQRKLSNSLRMHIAKLKPAQDRPTSPIVPKPGAAPKSLEVVPEGQAPRLNSDTLPVGVQPFNADAKVDVVFYLFGKQPEQSVLDQITKNGGSVVSSGRDETISVVRAKVPASKVELVAAVPEVREATLDPKFVKHNDVAQKILARNPPMFVPPIDGNGQIVGHSDSGLDNGKNDNTLHSAFRGRVKKVFALGRPAPANDWSDRGGHGSHTAGSILGAGEFPGIAPQAKLVHQSLDDLAGSLSGIPTPLGKLFQPAYDEGARVHSNSWGIPALDKQGNNVRGGEYLRGREVDAWSWNNGVPRDMLIVFSAGNDGNGTMTVTAPGTGKNCLTVGASENLRPAGGNLGDNVNDLATFSSKGPTRENRIKPDVVAPGTWIASAKTQGAQTAWQDSVESVIVNTPAPNAWKATPGFQHMTNPPGGALSQTGVWRLHRTAPATFQDILTTPTVALPAGHELFLEVWLRGNINGLDQFQLGYQSGGSIFIFDDDGRRQFANWTVIRAKIPDDLLGTPVRFVLVAQEASGITADITLFVDEFKLTTFSSWNSLSNLALAAPNDPIDRQFTLSGGTSMAAPLCAGCAVLVRQSLTDSGTANPSAELVKAILINSADEHQGDRPNFDSGWGLVNLRRAIEGNYEFDSATTLKNGESMSYDVPVAAGVKELRVTLVWADAPDAGLVNDLDLKVISPAGTEHIASPAHNNTPDRTNNVEGIDEPTPAVGTWKVLVKAHKVSPSLSQPFAVVISRIQ